MATLEALYLQDPFWIWLAFSCLFVALTMSTGSPVLMWPAAAAALVAVIELIGLRLGFGADVGIFAALCFVVVVGAYVMTARATAPASAAGADDRGFGGPASGRQDQTARLVGRIGRASSEFVNGVGRVWIEGAEWGAEIDVGEGNLPEGAPVRVVGIIGGIRLQVHGLYDA